MTSARADVLPTKHHHEAPDDGRTGERMTTETTKSTKPRDEFAEHAEAMADATAKVAEHEETFERAQSAVAGMKARLASGDETVTTDDYARALAAVDRAHLLLDGAEKRVKTLKDRAPFKPWVADMLAGVLSDELGVPVHVVKTLPTGAPEQTPALYLVQEKAAAPKDRTPDRWGMAPVSKMPDGSYSAIVRGKFFRPKWVNVSIDDSLILSALNKHYQGNFNISASSSGSVDSLRISVGWIFPDLVERPVAPTEREAKNLADALVYTIQRSGGPLGTVQEVDGMGFGHTVNVYRYDAKAIAHEIVAMKAANGIRRTTVDVVLDAWAKAESTGPVTPHDISAERVEAAISGYIGNVYGDFGRARELKVSTERMSTEKVSGKRHKNGPAEVNVFRCRFVFEAAA